MFRRKKPPPEDPLDRVIQSWPSGDVLTQRHLLNSILMMGRSGSGKTSGPLTALLFNILATLPDAGGLILASSTSDGELCRWAFDAVGRPDDLVKFDERGPYRSNLLDFACSHLKASTRDLTQLLMILGETLLKGSGGGDGDSLFWRGQQERQLQNAIVMLKLAYGVVTAPNIQLMITTAPKRVEHLLDESHQRQFHHQTILRARARVVGEIEKHDRSLALQYWQNEYPSMSDKLRTSIDVCSLGLLHELNTGLVRDRISTTTNLNVAAVDHGKWLLIDTPPCRCGVQGSLIQGAFQYLFQRWVMARDSSRYNPAAVLLADEYQNRVNSFDAQWLNESRKYGGCTIVATQSINSLYANMTGDHGRAFVDTLLSGFQTKIFCCLGDIQTSEWGSKLSGERNKLKLNGSLSPESIDAVDRLLGRSRATMGFGESKEPELEISDFIYGMRTGGPQSGRMVDSYVFRSGEKFAGNRKFIRVAWRQRG